MALQVWLPLTKDLRNQGLNDCMVEEVTSPVFDNNGKLGKALSEGKIRIPASKVRDIFNNNTMTVAFWYNNNTSSTSGNHAICGFSGNTEGDTDAVRIWDFFNYSVPTQFHWSMGTLGGGSLANAFPANTWVHVCVTWSAPTLKIYLDGVLKYTGSGSSNYTFNKSYYISFGHTPQKLNDFRIYNHCLSPMEVKKLSQGLILHYPLNRQGFGQENLAVDTAIASSINGKVYSLASAIPSGTKVTISCWIDADNVTMSGNKRIGLSSGISRSDGAGTQWFETWASYSNGLLSDNGSFHGRVSNTQTILGNMTQIGTYIQTLSSGTVSISQLKVELGDGPTPWCPNSSDALATTIGLNGTIEYDTSGYCNNGTRTGTFSWTSDTPKYSVSTYFEDGSTTYITTPVFMPTDKITTSVWFKGDGSTSGANSYHIPFCIGSGHAEFSIDGSKLYRQGYYINGTRYCDTISGAIVNDGEWHMMTATYDGTTLCRYLDGQLINSKNISGTLNGGNSTLLIGKYYSGGYNNKKIKQSDVRIYATALSADDVKSLYQNCATIDPDGTIRGKIR